MLKASLTEIMTETMPEMATKVTKTRDDAGGGDDDRRDGAHDDAHGDRDDRFYDMADDELATH